MQIEIPASYREKWTKAFEALLREQAERQSVSVRAVLWQQIASRERLQTHQCELGKAVEQLSHEPCYQVPAAELMQEGGVGILTAMTYLAEMGDPKRFHNRREVAANLGLCPASFESGERECVSRSQCSRRE